MSKLVQRQAGVLPEVVCYPRSSGGTSHTPASCGIALQFRTVRVIDCLKDGEPGYNFVV